MADTVVKLFDATGLDKTEQRRDVLQEAREFADAGGQALHVWQPLAGHVTPKSPFLFKKMAAAGKPWAHLFDNDAARLKDTGELLGIKKVVVRREGKPGQHIDLCGGPLDRARLRIAQEEDV